MSLAMVKTGVEISSNDEKITGPILLQALLTLWTHITWCYHQVYGTLIRLIPLESWRERLSSTKQDVKGKRTRSGSNAGKAGTGTTTPLRRSRRLKEKQAGNSPTASSSSSSDDQITDSDSNASDVQHPRQLGRLRSSTRPTKSLTRKNHPTSIRKPIPTHQVKKTLVLDLDETLIHSTSRGSRNHDHMVEVLVDRHVCLYYVYKRPYCDLFLKKVSEWYKVIIFTASMPEYADPVIDWLDPKRSMISGRLFRASCIHKNGVYIKDLSVVEPDMSRVCLVDNSPISYQDNEDNGIPIEGWISDPHDEALLDMLPFLDALRYVEDVRHVLSMK